MSISLDNEEHEIVLNCIKKLAKIKGEDVLGLLLKYSISKNIDEAKVINLVTKLTGECPPLMEH